MEWTDVKILSTKFNRLTPIRKIEWVTKQKIHWEFNCDCGSTTIKNIRDVIANRTTSCGCVFTEKLKKRLTLDSEKTAFNRIKTDYVGNCKKRNLKFELSDEEFLGLIKSNCHYCYNPPNNKNTNKNTGHVFNYNGIDRKNNEIGYNKDNCVTCCLICNRGKNTLSYEDFMCYIKRIKGVSK